MSPSAVWPSGNSRLHLRGGAVYGGPQGRTPRQPPDAHGTLTIPETSCRFLAVNSETQLDSGCELVCLEAVRTSVILVVSVITSMTGAGYMPSPQGEIFMNLHMCLRLDGQPFEAQIYYNVKTLSSRKQMPPDSSRAPPAGSNPPSQAPTQSFFLLILPRTVTSWFSIWFQGPKQVSTAN